MSYRLCSLSTMLRSKRLRVPGKRDYRSHVAEDVELRFEGPAYPTDVENLLQERHERPGRENLFRAASSSIPLMASRTSMVASGRSKKSRYESLNLGYQSVQVDLRGSTNLKSAMTMSP